MTNEKVDVLIVGGGYAASIFADKLMASGKQVLMLEAGPKRSMSDLYSSQIWARNKKWRGSRVIEKGNNSIVNNFNCGSGTGGSGMHHYANWFRLHEEDFHMYSQYGKGLDWPIDYDDLRPYYDRIQKEVGISGDAEAEIWRPPGDSYPMPPLPVFAQGQAIAKGFANLDMHTAPVPMAINSIEYNGRPACIYDGWCDAGCPTGALANPLATYLASALRAGADIMHETVVTRILTNAKGNRVTGVTYTDKEGIEHRQMADLVVLSAYTIQNPRLLLVSANGKHPQGLANGSGLVGKYLMTHPFCRISGLFNEATHSYMGPTGGQLVNQDNYEKNGNAVGFGSYQWLIANSVKPNDLIGIAATRADLYGEPLHRFLKDAAKYFATMVAVCEGYPHRENHILLNGTKDKYNVPLAEIHHTVRPETMGLWHHAREQGKAVFTAAGAREIWSGQVDAMHILGGTIMGKDPTQSVTNSYGQCHEVDNLFIAGAGLYPTSGGVNPTFTLSALASRTTDYISREWASLV